MTRPRRIGCYGLAELSAGSGISGNYLMLEELLRRGHELEFYGIRGYVEPRGLQQYANFRYHGYRVPAQQLYDRYVPASLRRATLSVAGPLSLRAHLNAIARDVHRHHAERPFDLMLFLGVAPPFPPPDAPTLAWVPSAPHAELDGIRRSRDVTVEHAGRLTYLALNAYYLWRRRSTAREVRRATLCVEGSPWSANELTRAYPEIQARALAYPVDLELFSPGGVRPVRDAPQLLWLGRITPRKRLDLMVDGFLRLLESEPGAYMRIVGGAPYAKGLLKLMDRLPRDRFEYLPRVDRASVPDLLRSTDVLVAPSENEDFGSAIAEALACGTAAVLGPSNGTLAYCEDAAFPFDDYTPASVARAIGDALDALRRDRALVRDRARRVAERSFSLAAIVDRLEQYLLEAERLHAGNATRVNGAGR